jgi:hypothetical protein
MERWRIGGCVAARISGHIDFRHCVGGNVQKSCIYNLACWTSTTLDIPRTRRCQQTIVVLGAPPIVYDVFGQGGNLRPGARCQHHASLGGLIQPNLTYESQVVEFWVL